MATSHKLVSNYQARTFGRDDVHPRGSGGPMRNVRSRAPQALAAIDGPREIWIVGNRLERIVPRELAEGLDVSGKSTNMHSGESKCNASSSEEASRNTRSAAGHI